MTDRLQIDEPIRLANGLAMPRVGFGLFRVPPGGNARTIVGAALAAGYRHLDTATVYRNEADVGAVLAIQPYAPDSPFVTTKLWNDDQGFAATREAFARSEAAIGVGRIDLYLLHWPVPGLRLESWRALEQIYREGRVRAIGVSNFLERHLEELLAHCEIPPMVNQVELSPFLQQRSLRAFCQQHAIPLVAYSPLTKGQRLSHPAVMEQAQRLGISPAQLLLRWALEQDVGVVVKSARPERMEENLNLNHCPLDATARAVLEGLEEGLVTGWDSRSVP